MDYINVGSSSIFKERSCLRIMVGNYQKHPISAELRSSAGVPKLRKRNSLRHALVQAAASFGAAAAHCGKGSAYYIAAILEIDDDSLRDGDQATGGDQGTSQGE